MSKLQRPKSAENGFSLLEVLVAITVLTIGLMSAAMLMAQVYKMSVQSRYMALATQLASEKLEDLNRFPNNTNTSPAYVDPHIMVPSGSATCGITGESCIGSLTADYGPQTITDAMANQTAVSYYDSVNLATVSQSAQTGTAQSGSLIETYAMPCTGNPAGVGNYVSVVFSPDGVPPSSVNPGGPANLQVQPPCLATPPAGMTFDRRWVIEQDQPVVGLRRITVRVELDDKSVQLYTGTVAPGQQPPASVVFQMSLVRP